MKMKFVFLALLIMSFQQVVSANCLGEAQIIGQVQSVKINKDSKSCTISLNPQMTRFFSENQICPLDLADVYSVGITYPLSKAGCPVQAGQDISGVLAVQPNGEISF